MSFIELDNVSYKYESTGAQALSGISLKFDEGEFTAVVGHNGSGKSTLAKLLNGLFLPNEGSVKVNGLNTLDDKNLFEIRKNVGVVFQNPDNQMVATVIEDDVAFGPENIGLPSAEIRERVDWALKSVGMYEYRLGMPHKLSGGQKQRIAIAGILAVRPRVMVLDESTSMLDPTGRAEVMDVVRRLNKDEKMAVIMITHFMEEAADADRIIVLNDGKVFADGGKEIFDKRKQLEEIGLEVPFAVRMADKLKSRGVRIDKRTLTSDELTEELCR